MERENSPQVKDKPLLTTRLSSKTINDLILKYRSGSIEAAEQLLQCFRPLIGKYLKLFFYGTYDSTDSDICKFLQACGKKDISKTAEIIRTRLRKYEASELVNIAQVALLETAKLYNSVSVSYKFVLHRYLKNMLWEDFPDGMPTLELSEEDYSKYKERHCSSEIDENWIRGVTTGVGFSELTDSQRFIVKRCYYDNIPDIHVAKELHITVSVLRRQKESIKDILATELNLRKLIEKGPK